jgi:hydroxyethylthiazole kinase-like sugar kinase family protein
MNAGYRAEGENVIDVQSGAIVATVICGCGCVHHAATTTMTAHGPLRAACTARPHLDEAGERRHQARCAGEAALLAALMSGADVA